MKDDLSEFNTVISLLESQKEVTIPDNFTQNIMLRITTVDKPNVFWAIKETCIKAAEISWSHFSSNFRDNQESSSYFLISGFFFFFVSTTLFSNAIYMSYFTHATAFTLFNAVIMLFASMSLSVAGLMLALNIPNALFWAKRAVMVYGVLMLSMIILIQSTVKTTPGMIISVLLSALGIITGGILLRSLGYPVLKKGVILNAL